MLEQCPQVLCCHKYCNQDLYRKQKINNIQQERSLCEQIKYL